MFTILGCSAEFQGYTIEILSDYWLTIMSYYKVSSPECLLIHHLLVPSSASWDSTSSYGVVVSSMYGTLLKHMVFPLGSSKLIHNKHQYDIMFYMHV